MRCLETQASDESFGFHHARCRDTTLPPLKAGNHVQILYPCLRDSLHSGGRDHPFFAIECDVQPSRSNIPVVASASSFIHTSLLDIQLLALRRLTK
jgi:hypothetical protein